MRIATIIDPDRGLPRPVIGLPDGRWALAEALTGPGGWAAAIGRIDDIAREFDARELSPLPGGESLQFLPPIPNPRTFRDFYAFEQHVATCRGKRGLPMEAAWYEQPAFYFSNPVSLIGHDRGVYPPANCQKLDYELELGLVIGRGGRDISRREAWRHVAGFTIGNDFSARDLQSREMKVGLGPAKGKDFATAVGPCLVTLAEVSDRIDANGRLQLKMTARINGVELSRGDAASMYFTWPQIIEHASRDAELTSGDLLGSGTVGTGCILELGPENTGGWLKAGDVVELEIERIGILRTPIVERPASAGAREETT